MGVKHVSTVFGQRYIKGALLMISSTSNKIVCSSSKWLQKIGVGGVAPPPRPPLKSASEGEKKVDVRFFLPKSF